MRQSIETDPTVNPRPMSQVITAVLENRAHYLSSRSADAAAAVELGEASWAWPWPAVVTAHSTPEADGDLVLIDDDGTPLEPLSVWDARYAADHAALVAVTELRADWLIDRPTDEDEDWDDAHRWELGPDPEPEPSGPYRDDIDDFMPSAADEEWLAIQTTGPQADSHLTMVEVVEGEARRYRGWGTDLGDLLAERADLLLGQIRLLDATSPEQFCDRRDAMIASAVAKVNGRAGR